jgi:L-iditol 2-dehydrogenase
MSANTMLAAVYHGPGDLRVEQVPVPDIAGDEVLLKVLGTNICGTDLRILHGGHRKYPEGTIRIPGHETVGVISEIGSAVTGFERGQRVFIAPNIGTGSSRETISGNNNLDPDYEAIGITMDGSFAEYVRVPGEFLRQGNLMPVSEDLDPAVAALIEPLACVLRGQNAVHLNRGDVVVIMGAGPIGALHLLLAQLSGAARVIVSEPFEYRREQALYFGADRVVNPLEEDLEQIVWEESAGRGADVIIVAAPSKPAQEMALEIAAIGGRINLFGGLPKDDPYIRFNANTVHYKELVVTGTTACSTWDCMRAADLVNAGRLDLKPLVTSRYPLSQAVEAFKAAVDGINLRVCVEP